MGGIRPPQSVAGHAWLSTREANGNKRERGRSSEMLFRQPSDPDSLRGRSVQEQPNDSETNFPIYKTYTSGRNWDRS